MTVTLANAEHPPEPLRAEARAALARLDVAHQEVRDAGLGVADLCRRIHGNNGPTDARYLRNWLGGGA